MRRKGVLLAALGAYPATLHAHVHVHLPQAASTPRGLSQQDGGRVLLCRVHAAGDARRAVYCVGERQAAARQAREVRRRRGAATRRASAVGGGVDAWSAGAAAPPRLLKGPKKAWAVPPPPPPPPLPPPAPPAPPAPPPRQHVGPPPGPPPPQTIEVALIGCAFGLGLGLDHSNRVTVLKPGEPAAASGRIQVG